MNAPSKPAAPLAKRIQGVLPSLTLAIEAKAKRLKEEGVDVISFSAGEPDFDTPEGIKQATIQSLKQGFTKYTPASGILPLRKAISQKLARDNHLRYQPEQIVVSCGAKHAIYNILQVLVDEGDEVVIPSPYWLSYPEVVRLAGGKAVFLKTTFESGYQFTPEDLERAVTPKTKVLLLNSPSNPTGSVLSLSQLQQIARVARAHRFFILSDEIYEQLIFDGLRHHSIGALDPALLERTITVGGASKTYAMTGWRLGFSASPRPIADACGALQSHSTSNPTSFAQAGYLEALERGASEVQAMRSEFEKRRDLVFRLTSQIPKLKPFKPSGAFYQFIDISQTGLSSVSFATRLLDEARVAVVPGESFGHDEAIRISFATSERLIEAGMARMADWLGALRRS